MTGTIYRLGVLYVHPSPQPRAQRCPGALQEQRPKRRTYACQRTYHLVRGNGRNSATSDTARRLQEIEPVQPSKNSSASCFLMQYAFTTRAPLKAMDRHLSNLMPNSGLAQDSGDFGPRTYNVKLRH